MDCRYYIFNGNNLVVDCYSPASVENAIKVERQMRAEECARNGVPYTSIRYQIIRGCFMDTVPYPNHKRLSLPNVNAAKFDTSFIEPLQYFAIEQGVRIIGTFGTLDKAVKFIRDKQKEELKAHQWLHNEYELIAGNRHEYLMPDPHVTEEQAGKGGD